MGLELKSEFIEQVFNEFADRNSGMSVENFHSLYYSEGHDKMVSTSELSFSSLCK